MSLSYRFILELAANHHPPPARLLDFGCGAGEVVAEGLRLGFDSWGVDTFEGVWDQYGGAAGEHQGRVIQMAAGQPLPFDDGSFDIVVTNQVFEHIEDPLPALREIARVLRPSRLFVAIFPTREVVVEPHLHVPFMHWLRTGSNAQQRALRLYHALRLPGASDNPRNEWVASFIGSLQNQTFYRDQHDTLAMFTRYFRLVTRGEADFIADRVRHSRLPRWSHALATSPICEPFLRWACVRLAGVVLVFRALDQSELRYGGKVSLTDRANFEPPDPDQAKGWRDGRQMAKIK